MNGRPRILANPSAGGGRTLRAIRRIEALADLELRPIASPEAMTAQARRAADEGVARVIVAGGDGAVHHALQGLVGRETALAILPVGSGNDLARALGIPLDARAAARLALEGRPRAIDVGRVGERFFAGVLGLGIDGDVCRLVNADPPWWRGTAAYAWASLRAFVRYRPPLARVAWDEGRFEGRLLLGALANSPYFGGGMRIAPEARLDDGALDLVLVEQVPLVTLLRVFPRVYRGRHVGHPAVHVARVRRARLEVAPARWLWADGEPVVLAGSAPVEVEILPAALRVIE